MRRDVKRATAAFLCGATFAAGLTLAGASRPDTVFAAFDPSSWDPRLFVMFAASLLVHAPASAWLRRGRPAAPSLPGRIDARLVIGSLIFGAGWGLSGVCPGPAFTAALVGGSYTTTFIAGLAAGIFLHHLVDTRSRRFASASPHQAME